MRNAEQWMETAVSGEEVQRLVPLGYQPTLPELYRGEDGITLRFFYYKSYLEGEKLCVEPPEFSLEFDPIREVQTGFHTFSPADGRVLDGSDALEEDFARSQWAYLAGLDGLLARLDSLGSKELEELHSRWPGAHARALTPFLIRLTDRDGT